MTPNPITAAFVAVINSPGPRPTVTATFANGRSAHYSAHMANLLASDPATLEIMDDDTGEIIYNRD